MATDRLKTVAPSGGDYSAMKTAVDTEIDDLVLDDVRLVLRAQGDWSTKDTYTTTIDITGYTVDATRYIYLTTINGSGGAQHDGTHWVANVYEVSNTAQHVFTVDENYTVLEAMVIKQDGTGNSDEGVRMDAGSHMSVINACIIWADSKDNSQDGVYCTNSNSHTDGHTIYLYNDLIIGFERGGVHYQCFTNNADNQFLIIRNCTVVFNGTTGRTGSCGISIQSNSTHTGTITITVHNTISAENLSNINGADMDFGQYGSGTGSIVWAGDYNCNGNNDTTDDQMPGGNSLWDRTVTEATSPGAGDWIMVIDDGNDGADFSTLDMKLQDDLTNNDVQEAGTATYIPPSPYEKDCLFATRHATDIDLGWHAVTVVAGGPDLQELDDAIPVGDVDTENPTTVEDATIPVGDVLANKPVTVEDAAIPVGDTLTTPLITLALSDDIPAGDDLTTPLVVAPESDDIPVGDVDTQNVFPPALTDNIPVGDDLTTLPLNVQTLDDAIPVGDVDTENPTTAEDDAIPVSDVLTNKPIITEDDAIPVGDDLTTLPLFVETMDDNIPVGDVLTTPLVIAPETDDIPVGDVLTTPLVIVTLSDDLPVGDDLTATPTGDVVSEDDPIPVGDVLTTPLIILTLEDSAPVGDLDTENVFPPALTDAIPVGDDLNPFVPVTTPQGVITLRVGRDLEAPVKLTRH